MKEGKSWSICIVSNYKYKKFGITHIENYCLKLKCVATKLDDKWIEGQTNGAEPIPFYQLWASVKTTAATLQ